MNKTITLIILCLSGGCSLADGTMQWSDEAAYVLPPGILRFENPQVTRGLVLLLGKRDDRGDVSRMQHLKDLEIDLVHSMRTACENQTTNVLYINIHGQNLTLENIEAVIQDFATRHTEINIISMIHGAVVFPGSGHVVDMSPIGWGYADGYLAGYFVSTYKLFQAIARAVNGRPVNLWQCSCQGGQTIGDAQRYLPQGSLLMTESKGWVLRPEGLMYALNQMLQSGHTFDFKALVVGYAFADKFIRERRLNESDWYYQVGNLNENPMLTRIGGQSQSFVEHADRFIERYRKGQVSEAELSGVLVRLCEWSGNVYNVSFESCMKYWQDLLKSMQNFSPLSCLTHRGESSYVVERVKRLFSQGGFYSDFGDFINLYMFSLGLGAVLALESGE